MTDRSSPPDRWQRLGDLFDRARGLTGGDRASFVERETEGDEALSAELHSLLRADDGAGDFMDDLRSQVLDPELDQVLDRATGDEEIDPWVGRQVSRYTIEARMGDGGMGVVYRALDATLGRSVALKFIAPEISGDADAKRRFLREARTASALDHPNICTIYDVDEEEGGRLFIAMAAYEGETLQDRIARGPLSETEAISIFSQMSAALAAAHAKGIVHRDVKPGNVFLTEAGTVKLLDFGLARTVGAPVTDPAMVKGTIHYMSPEQVRGEITDSRSDVWSAGVVLFEMLTGARPFDAHSPLVTVRTILSVEPDVEQRCASVSEATRRILTRSLAKRLDQRFADGGDLVTALGERHGPG